MVEGKLNTANPAVQRRVLMVDEDKDRYRRKERNDALKQAGYKVFPVLRMQDVCMRCKPGAFDLVIVNGMQNPDAALEVSDQIKASDPSQKLLLILSRKPEGADRDFIVSNWEEGIRRIGGGDQRKDLAAA